MGTPAQVREKLCIVIGVVASTFLQISVGIEPVPSRARADEAKPACVDPSPYAHSVVSITRYFDTARPGVAGTEVVGERATAWFYQSPRHLVTAAHFANGFSPER